VSIRGYLTVDLWINDMSSGKTILEPPARFPVVGILGAGQLAQMLAQAAWPLGLSVKVLVSHRDQALPGLDGVAVEGDANDPETAVRFARSVDVVALENEFVDPRALAAIEQSGIPLLPTLSTILLIQDKWRQKQALMEAAIPVTACASVEKPDDVAGFAEKHGWPVVLKRRHFGYDGKGNATVRTPAELPEAWKKLRVNENGLYVEAFCPFSRELAVIVCRSITGETAVYPVVDTVQQDHICHVVRAPGRLPDHLAEKARAVAVSAVEAIGGVGAMGVEFFLTAGGGLLVNELAPRVHNSGHYTIEACDCSQFENHLRAILGWPLGPTRMIRPAAVMINLLGLGDGPARPRGLKEALAIPGARVHVYGKSKSSRGRKMGHVTALGDTREAAEETARAAAGHLCFGEGNVRV
jgi:5-(carboxyamino)imidazole ribonucleotide synthase